MLMAYEKQIESVLRSAIVKFAGQKFLSVTLCQIVIELNDKNRVIYSKIINGVTEAIPFSALYMGMFASDIERKAEQILTASIHKYAAQKSVKPFDVSITAKTTDESAQTLVYDISANAQTQTLSIEQVLEHK